VILGLVGITRAATGGQRAARAVTDRR